ncbi:hypothetical protein DFH06DRAFT_1147981 [Mycena polygramma]|nr:hypothetical protein DFH06DRAFT_1147981 [Mycena polygramma]
MEVGSRVPTKFLDLPAKVRVEVPTKAPDGRRMLGQSGLADFHWWPERVTFQDNVDNEDETVKTFRDHVEIGFRAYSLFGARDLEDEKEPLSKAVASLNTVRRKGKGNIHILELREDDGDKD